MSRRPCEKTVVSLSCQYESVWEVRVPWAGALYWLTRGQRYSDPFLLSVQLKLLIEEFYQVISYLLLAAELLYLTKTVPTSK